MESGVRAQLGPCARAVVFCEGRTIKGNQVAAGKYLERVRRDTRKI